MPKKPAMLEKVSLRCTLSLRKIAHFCKARRTKLVVLPSVVLIGLVVHVYVYFTHDGNARAYVHGKRIEGSSLEIKTQNAAESLSSITIIADQKNVKKRAEELGASLDLQDVAQQLQATSSWRRFVPLYGIYDLLRPISVVAEYSINDLNLAEAAGQLSTELTYKAKNASLTLSDNRIVVTPEGSGMQYDYEHLQDTIRNYFNNFQSTNEIAVRGKPIEPTIRAEDLMPIAQRYQDFSTRSLTVQVDEQQFTLSSSDVFGLLDVAESTVKLNTTKVDELIDVWADKVAITPGFTHITYVDDVVTETRNGTPGRTLERENVITELEKWLVDPVSDSVSLKTTLVQPQIIATKTYTATSVGLQKLLNDWTATHPGSYRIAVRELNGQGRAAYYDGLSTTVMASTYKVFLSVAAYRMVENGELSKNTIIANGKNIEQCIEGGIVQSENTCMEALGSYIGWAKVDTILRDMGYSSITLNKNPAQGNAQDQAKLLMHLSAGSILNATHTDNLLSSMKKQVYRDGIPAGVQGAVVANKVGFIDSYKHDMGIVYGKNSTYAVVILTDTSSWGLISELADEIHKILENR